MIMSNIGENIKRIRKSKGLTQADLVKMTGIGQGHISEIENDLYPNAGTSTIMLIAKALDVTIEEITGMELPKPKIDPDIQRILDEMPEDAKIFFRQKGKMHPADVEAVIGLIRTMVNKYKDD